MLASSPGVLQNRIATLEAELASLRKELLGHEAIDITVNVVGEQMNDRVLRNEKAFMLKLRLHESPPKSLGTPVAPPGVSRLMFGGDTHTHPVWPTLTLLPSGPYPVSYILTLTSLITLTPGVEITDEQTYQDHQLETGASMFLVFDPAIQITLHDDAGSHGGVVSEATLASSRAPHSPTPPRRPCGLRRRSGQCFNASLR